MQSTGIIRRIDELGRFVIPKEMRRYLGLEGDAAQLEIYLENDCIVLKKYDETKYCAICGSDKATVDVTKGKCVCTDCILAIRKL